MPDPATPPATGEPAPAATSSDGGGGGNDSTSNGGQPLGPEGEKALEAFKQRAREAEKERNALRSRVEEFENANKSEQEKLEGKLVDAEKRAESNQTQLLRYEVAAEKELPLKWASRLSGSTKEELEADADELLKEINPGPRTNHDPGPRDSADDPADMTRLIRRRAGRSA